MPTQQHTAKVDNVRAEYHHLFGLVRGVVEYHRVRRPRVSLLETTKGALEQDVLDGAVELRRVGQWNPRPSARFRAMGAA